MYTETTLLMKASSCISDPNLEIGKLLLVLTVPIVLLGNTEGASCHVIDEWGIDDFLLSTNIPSRLDFFRFDLSLHIFCGRHLCLIYFIFLLFYFA